MADAAGNRELQERYFEAFNRHDLDELMRCFADDATFDSPLGEPDGRRLAGREPIRAYYQHFLDDLEGVRFEELSHWGADDRACSEWTLHATTRGGRVMRLRGCDLFVFRNGRITHKDTYLKQVR